MYIVRNLIPFLWNKYDQKKKKHSDEYYTAWKEMKKLNNEIPLQNNLKLGEKKVTFNHFDEYG